jgi:hypothetical protein
MKVNVQLHAPASLPPEKSLPVPIEYEAGLPLQRVHKVREHFKLFSAQELQIYRYHIRVILKRNSKSVYVPPMRVILSFTDSQR